MKTGSTNKKIRELISMVKEDKLIPQPEFQRRLVWSRVDKNHFLDSILRGYPFPELYLADGDVDLDTGAGTQLLVDGLQRVTTIIQYFNGDSDLKLLTVPAYKDLTEEEKTAYLQYDVAVRDLGSLKREEIVEVFRRLNATNYSLMDIEINNAVYAGALKQFAENVSGNEIFLNHRVFTSLDYKRMGDLRYALFIIITCIGGYFNRDDEFEKFLERYNDDFPLSGEISARLNRTFDFINECGFVDNERVWRKADLFTLIIEIDQQINIKRIEHQPSEVVERVHNFFSSIGDAAIDDFELSGIYYKAALQASNDKVNRLRRGIIMSGVIAGSPEDEIWAELKSMSLVKT